MSIKNTIALFQQEISTRQCRLVAISKTHPPEKITEAYAAGQQLFGENKVQEMVAKYEVLPKDIQWHMVGHLQSNKVKFIAPFVALIHSVDSQKLLDEINKQGKKINRVIPCLLQVHIAEEETKFGFDEKELEDLARGAFLPACEFVKVTGLMGMATLTNQENQIRKEFRHLKNIFDRIREKNLPHAEMKELSMGMSSDYKIALEEGSTLVRIGTAIFGERNYPAPQN